MFESLWLKQWYLMPPWLTTSIISYGSSVKWTNTRTGVSPPTSRCISYWKESLWVTLDYGRQLYFYLLYIYIYIYILSSTDRLFHCIHNSMWLDTQDGSSWDWNPPNYTLDFVSYHSTISRQLSNAKSANGGNDSIFGFSFYNIHVIQNPQESLV